MTKIKKKKKLSHSKLNSAKSEPKKLNAFEMHVNRRKFDVVGMKSKAEKGLPGISRSRAIKKRKATLMQEYRIKDKKNTFLDRRIGERNSAMTQEDKIMARFTAQRAKYHSKKSLFNLGDGEELTHRGETLTEIEKYDDPKSEDEFDDDDDRDGKLDADFVKEAHFGGGIFKKVEGESMSRKDLIEQLIAESKKRKAEKQKIREETIDLTQKLDSEWKELLPLVTSAKKSDSDADGDVKKDKKTASYDMLTKQLKFEARGKPMDKLKSEEELAKQEKEKLEALEKERLERMMGETKKGTIKHRSADDLDDGFDLDDQEDFILSYDKDGMPNVLNDDDKFEKTQTGGSRTIKAEENTGKESDGEDEEEESEEDGKEGEEDVEQEEADDGSEQENGEEDENATSDEDLDNLSDLKESDESEEEEEEKMESDEGPEKKKPKRAKLIENINEKKSEKRDSESKCEKHEKNKKKSKDCGEGEKLPYTFEIPNDYDSFEKLIAGSDYNKQAIIIERMIKCNHPSLKDSNKDKLETLFTFLLQHLEDVATDFSPEANCFKVLDSIAPFLYDLTVWNPEASGSAMLTVVREKYQNFLKSRNTFPGLDTLIFIKLISILFSTSDYRHVVATPTVVCMEHALATCRVASSIDLSLGLLMSTLVLEYCTFSKRLVPEVFHFIRGVLRLSHPKDSKIPVYLPFKAEDAEKFNLIVSDKTKSYTVRKLGYRELTVEDNSDEFKVNAIGSSLKILSELCDLMSDKLAAIILFESFLPLLQVENFSSCLKSNVDEVVGKIMVMKCKPLQRLVFEKKRPRPLKLYEPRIEQVYSLKKHKTMGREKQERAKLQHKLKREMKGALREIRKDNSFLAKLKFKEIQKSDAERHQKVREILSSVAQQTGEVRKLKRKKR